nr:hypothetical protein [Tanacetum cinerariifolium]
MKMDMPGVSSRGSQPRMASRVLMNLNFGIHNTLSREGFDGKSGFASSHGNHDGDHGEANQVRAPSRVSNMTGLDSRTKCDLLSTLNPGNELFNSGDGSISVANTVNGPLGKDEHPVEGLTQFKSSLLVSPTAPLPLEQYNVDVAATFGVLLTTIDDLDVLTKDIKAGKNEELLSGMTNDKRKAVMDALVAMCDLIEAENTHL